MEGRGLYTMSRPSSPETPAHQKSLPKINLRISHFSTCHVTVPLTFSVLGWLGDGKTSSCHTSCCPSCPSFCCPPWGPHWSHSYSLLSCFQGTIIKLLQWSNTDPLETSFFLKSWQKIKLLTNQMDSRKLNIELNLYYTAEKYNKRKMLNLTR